MTEKPCEECGKDTPVKYLGKIRGKQLCKKCRRNIRLKHRAETFKMTDNEEKAKILSLQKKQEAEYNQAAYKRARKDTIKEESKGVEPKIKGSVRGKIKKKSNSYITIQERQKLFKNVNKKRIKF